MSQRRALGAVLPLALLALLGSCRYPATQLAVRIDTDMTWGPGGVLGAVELTTWRGATTDGSGATLTFQQTFQLSSRYSLPSINYVQRVGEVRTPVTVRLVALDANQRPLFETRAIATFADRQTSFLEMYLAGRCRFPANQCAPDQTCGRRGCESVYQPSLPTVGPDDPRLSPDSTAPGDDASLDAPSEATVPDAPPPSDASDASAVLDSAPDAPLDSSPDSGSDTAPDAALDASPADALPDAPPRDATADAPLDAPADTSAPADALEAEAAAPDATPAGFDTQPVSPASASRVYGRTVVYRWVVGSGDRAPTGVRVCRDRALTLGCMTLPVSGTGSPVSSTLAGGGVYFWQLQGTARGASAPVWEFLATGRTSSVEAACGALIDERGDGTLEALAGAPGAAVGTRGRANLVALSGSSVVLTDLTTALVSGLPYEMHTLGAAVASAGDVDGDGFNDLLVGAPDSAPVGGFVLVLRGSAAGFTSVLSVLTNPSGTNVGFGSALSSAGDLDGDGYGDFVVGSPGANGTIGMVTVYRGSPSGVVLPPTGASATSGLSGFRFGAALSPACVTSALPYGSFAVGVPGAAAGSGQVHVYASNASFSFSTTILDGSGGGAPPSGLGSSVALGGDLDGDGRPELLAGAPLAGAVPAGTTLVYQGATGNYRSLAVVRLGSSIPTYLGLGSSVAGDADLDADGFDDVLVGAPNGGYAFVYRGSSALATSNTPWATLDRRSAMESYGAQVAILRMPQPVLLVSSSNPYALWNVVGGPTAPTSPGASTATTAGLQLGASLR